MFISYPMIAAVCRQSDDLADAGKSDEVFAQIGITRSKIVDWSVERGSSITKAFLHEEKVPPECAAMPGKLFDLLEDRLLPALCTSWYMGFCHGVSLHQRQLPVTIQCIDDDSTKTAASQRAMRILFWVVRQEEPPIGEIFNCRPEPIRTTSRDVLLWISTAWSDGCVAGFLCSQKVATVMGATS